MSRLLIVEDSQIQTEYLRFLLEEEGFIVEAAQDGEQALGLLQTSVFDLVLSDVLMPGIDGYELCRRIKGHPTRGQVPVILLTSLNGPLDILQGIECGADNYVIKPFDAATLLSRIRSLFANRARRVEGKREAGVKVTFLDRTFTINSGREQILDLLIATCEDIVRTNRELRASQVQLEEAKAQIERHARLMEGQARFSEDKYRRLMDRANDAIILSDKHGRVLEVNRRAEELLGLPAAKIIGRSHESFVTAEELEAERTQFRKILAEGHTRRDNARLRRADGQPVAVDYSASLVELKGETVVLSIVHDASERNRLEAQLRQSQKMEAVGRLAGGVAHDFNNLIQVITGYGEIVLASLSADHPARDMVKEMIGAGERAAGLTRQLLAFSRQQVVMPRVLDLNTVVAGVGKLLQRLIGEDVELTTVLEPALGRLKADQGQVEQVLMNLAVNARDAMPQGGKLTIETANVELDASFVRLRPEVAPGPYVLLAVSDTGIGMDEATKARVFEPFFTTKEVGRGTGLGLATVYGIVKQAGGYVYVSSEPGRGTCFNVYLPRVPEEAERAEPNTAPARQAGTETILLVEDEAGVRALTREVLSIHGYTVLEAPNGAEALRHAERHTGPIHLLLTDVVMPGLGGRELANRLSALRPETKVLYVSGYADDAIIRHGVLSSEADFLQKPYTVDVLTHKVGEVLARPNRRCAVLVE